MLPGMGQNLDTFIAKWAAAGAAERANKDMFLTELCGVLGVAPPNPAMGDAERDTYVFEREARLSHEGGEAKRSLGQSPVLRSTSRYHGDPSRLSARVSGLLLSRSSSKRASSPSAGKGLGPWRPTPQTKS